MYRELLGELAAEILAGEASTLYNRLYEEGLVDGALYVGYESIKDACLLSISGDSPEPDKVYEAILTEARRLAVDGYDEAEFNRLLRSFLGRRIRELDSFFSICYRICAYEFEDYEFFTFPAEYSAVTLPRVLEFLAAAVCRNHSAMAVVLPVEDTV